MSEGALSGLRVVDMSRVLAGPLCAMLLGDLGADVVKVERPGKGDDTRAWGPPFIAGESAYYLSVNRNKRGTTLDPSTEAGREVLRRLLGNADVLVENFKPGTLESWGFEDEWFEEHAPRLVRATISGYGSAGPKAGKPGYDFVAQAESGLMAITGEPDGQPLKLGVAIVDVCAGMMTAIGVLAALTARAGTGRGQRVEVNLHDTGLLMLANVAENHLVSGDEAGRYGNSHPNIVPYRTYEASDGAIALAIGNDRQFRAFAGIAGHPDWADHPRFATNSARVTNREEIDGLIGAVVATRTRAEWMEALDEPGIPAGPINLVSEALSSPHAATRGMVVEVEHPLAGMLKILGLPFELAETPASIRRAPPTLGQHTDQVMAELGYDAAAIEALRADGVV